ncbi:hypothetical protein BWQ96_03127 [Gracilariopsis chorda]|uniref:Uncharacterized protein n=1 Tax=Gracilariopsis chorda TaxID=448386 RepID=A0A2V3J0Z7_9FLOR|nr:hypothetical protein BWQ96_03127 [Gracilariopsis chorda]|eukprot:PXF47050.1 hypothetical protein BWQ96_03127 [Gracilariopsis chorda]
MLAEHCKRLLVLMVLLICSVQESRSEASNAVPKITLLHLHDNAPFFSDLGALTLSNKRRYASRHNYEIVSHTPSETHGLFRRAGCSEVGAVKRGEMCYVEDNNFAIDRRAPTFGKIKLALAACVGRKGHWLLWSDADALIVNQSIPLTDIIDDRYDMALTVDWLMINAGVILVKCSRWSINFLKRVYAAREFDKARALDQSAFQHFFDTERGIEEHVRYVPKWAMNVYAEEYQAGDFVVHMAGKLYEATTKGALAVAHQFDVLSTVAEQEDIEAFFRTQYMLNYYSGICVHNSAQARDSECKPDDERRLRLKEALSTMSSPTRYRHVALRYYWMPDWRDKYDTPNWNADSVAFDSQKRLRDEHNYDEAALLGLEAQEEEEASHDEL